jgi:ribosomal protein S11
VQDAPDPAALGGAVPEVKKYPDTVIAQAQILFVQGYTDAEIGEIVGAPRGTIASWACRGGWSIAKPRNEGQHFAAQSAQNLALKIANEGQKYRGDISRGAAATAKLFGDTAERDPLAGLALARAMKDVHTVAKDVFEIGQAETVVNLAILDGEIDDLQAISGQASAEIVDVSAEA